MENHHEDDDDDDVDIDGSDDDSDDNDDSDDDGSDYTCGSRPRGPNMPGKNLDLVRGSRGPSTVTYHEKYMILCTPKYEIHSDIQIYVQHSSLMPNIFFSLSHFLPQ